MFTLSTLKQGLRGPLENLFSVRTPAVQLQRLKLRPAQLSDHCVQLRLLTISFNNLHKREYSELQTNYTTQRHTVDYKLLGHTVKTLANGFHTAYISVLLYQMSSTNLGSCGKRADNSALLSEDKWQNKDSKLCSISIFFSCPRKKLSSDAVTSSSSSAENWLPAVTTADKS